MSTKCFRNSFVRGGFVLIELLLVLVVIAILAGGFFHKGTPTSQSTYQMSMSRSKDAACKANRSTLRTTIEMFKMGHPGEPVTMENMQKAGVNLPTCPEGGAYGYTADGNIICSKHPDEPAK